tara:strand:+ start:230 stop:538 length:309 start_codon:yes stop_codon:yes gene_type:complete
MIKIKKNDDVQVVSGNYRGETGRVIKVLHSKNRVIVEGVNKAKKHIRPTQDNPQGGIVEKELSIHISNLMLIHKGKPVKVGFEILKDGKKVRINKKNNEVID